MGLFKKRPKSVADNPTFIRMIQITRDDPALGARLVQILSLDPFYRSQSLQSLLNVMETTRAPKELIAAVAALLDDEIADKVLAVLLKETTNG
jgi:hypothetical protein